MVRVPRAIRSRRRAAHVVHGPANSLHTAAREGGHRTHGDGTALDLIPARPADQTAWDESAAALARDLGWTRNCGASGVRRPAIVPAGASDAVHRLRGLPRPRLTRHLPHALPGAPAHLLGLPVLRHQRAHGTMRVGDDLRPFARSLRHRRPARTRAVTDSPPGPHSGAGSLQDPRSRSSRVAVSEPAVVRPRRFVSAVDVDDDSCQSAIPPPGVGSIVPGGLDRDETRRNDENHASTQRPHPPSWPVSGPIDVNRRRPDAGEPDSPRSALSPRQSGTS